MTENRAERVVVIGGGAAGLSAANRLQDAGIDAVIVEGRSRLGGRIHTVDVDGSDTAWVDMGAAWIDDHRTNRVYHLIEPAGAGVEPTLPRLTNVRAYDERPSRWVGRGRTMLAMAKYAWRSHRLKRPTTEFADLGERIDAMLGDNPDRADEYLVKATAELLDGGPVGNTHQNAFSDGPWEYLRYKEKTSVMVVGGFRHVVDALSAPLDNDRIFLDHEVVSVSCSSSSEVPHPIRVETANGTTFEGTHVIVTVPIGVLQANAIAFDPPLPAEKQDVIERMGVGNVEKVALTFASPFWREKPDRAVHFFSVPNSYAPQSVIIDVTDTAGAAPGGSASACLVAICAAEVAKATADRPHDAVEATLATLQRMFPNRYQPPVATAVSTWSSDPFSQGVYSYPTPRTRPGDYALLGEPIHDRKVLFAGDWCTAGTYLSSVEGAIVSGERAAEAIIDAR
ncbi:MAG: flavin monoamine oxidase family protein [Acidimicrobiales bacterium]